MENEIHMCDFGCGQVAIHQFQNGKWGCSKIIINCKKIKENNLKTFSSKEFSEKMRKSKIGVKRTPEVCKRLSESHTGKKLSPETIEKIRNSTIGRSCWNKGKNWPSKVKKKISDSSVGKKHSPDTIEKLRTYQTPEVREKHRQRMLNGGTIKAHQGIRNPSKPQVELFKKIKELYPDAKLNYPFKRRKKGHYYFLDVSIPHLMICFESNGTRWHNKEKDLIRKQEVENEGWTMIEYYDVNYVKQVPTIEKIKEDIENVIKLREENNYDKAQVSC